MSYELVKLVLCYNINITIKVEIMTLIELATFIHITIDIKLQPSSSLRISKKIIHKLV